jgi:hypothetical protein
MRFHVHSEPGGKPDNEDHVLVRRHPMAHDLLLCFLADGQGGRAHGAEASQKACKAAWQLAWQSTPSDLLDVSHWEDLLDEVDIAVSETGGYTTLVGAAFSMEEMAGGSCGDSKLYRHCHETKSIEEWTTLQPRNPPVGSGECQFLTFHREVIEGDRFLILSDGVWKYCGYEPLKSAFNLPDLVVAPLHLRTATLERAGRILPDDFSLIALDFS